MIVIIKLINKEYAAKFYQVKLEATQAAALFFRWIKKNLRWLTEAVINKKKP